MKNYYELKREEQKLRVRRDAADRKGEDQRAQEFDDLISDLRKQRMGTSIPVNNPHTHKVEVLS